MRNVIYSVVLLGGVISCTWSQSVDKPAFDTGYVARRYLWYFSIMNTFDTCLVEYVMGEVVLRSPTASWLVYLRVSMDERLGQCIHGRDEQGIDSILQTRCVSYPFVIPDSASIGFFRVLKGAVLCGKGRGEPRLPLDSVLQPVLHNTVEKSWTLYPHCIQDRSEFVIELVRASDETVLLTLDSIGVEPNPHHAIPRRYGTAPDARVREVALPPAVWGQTAYLRVSPRRYGDTPYGMELRKHSSEILLSLLYPNSDTLAFVRRAIAPLVTGQKDTLYAARIAAIFDYIAHEGSQSGCIAYLPIPRGESIEEDEQLYDSLIAYITANGYDCADCPGDIANSVSEECRARWQEQQRWYSSTFDDTTNTLIPRRNTLASVTVIVPMEQPSPRISIVNPVMVHQPITLVSTMPVENARVLIYDLTGRQVLDRMCTLLRGTTAIPHALPRGVYLLVIQTIEGVPIRRVGIIVQ